MIYLSGYWAGATPLQPPYQTMKGGEGMTEKLFRINSRIGKTQNEWLEQESQKTGISKSALMQMALEQYISQKDAISAMNNMTDLYNKLDGIEQELKDIRAKNEKK